MFQLPGTQGIRVKQFILRETGTYNPQFRKPFVTQPSNMHTINALAERLEGAQKYAPSQFTGLANQFLAPKTEFEKEIAIPRGWSERRVRFMLEVEIIYAMGAKLTEIILGFTDYVGMTLNSNIDPNMVFYINSILQIRETAVQTPYGIQTVRNIADASHVLANNNFDNVFSNMQDQKMRPEDLYATMERSHVSGLGTVTDTRCVLNKNAIKSKRSNGVAANYMAGILQSYKDASLAHGNGIGEQEKLAEARGYSREQSAAQDSFLQAVANVRSMVTGMSVSGPTNTFSFGDLNMIDPNADNLTLCVHSAQQQQISTPQPQPHIAGQTMPWSGTDLCTQAATILSQSIPSLLMESALTRIVFQITNRTVNGQIYFTPQVTKGLSEGVDMTEFIHKFGMRATDVIADLTSNNSLDIALEMSVDLLGETWIKISMCGGPTYDYVTPSFCDSLMVPVITASQDLTMTVAKSFESLMGVLHHTPDNDYDASAFGKF